MTREVRVESRIVACRGACWSADLLGGFASDALHLEKRADEREARGPSMWFHRTGQVYLSNEMLYKVYVHLGDLVRKMDGRYSVRSLPKANRCRG